MDGNHLSSQSAEGSVERGSSAGGGFQEHVGHNAVLGLRTPNEENVKDVASALLGHELLHPSGYCEYFLHILLRKVFHRNHVFTFPSKVIVLEMR